MAENGGRKAGRVVIRLIDYGVGGCPDPPVGLISEQAGGQAGRPTCDHRWSVSRQAGRQADGQAGRRAGGRAGRQAGRQAGGQADRRAGR